MEEKRFLKELGSRMRTFRVSGKLTQAQIAEKVGVEQSFYSQVERGAATPSIKSLLAIARALGVEVIALLPGERRIKFSAEERAIIRLLRSMDQKKRRAFVEIVSEIASRLNRL